LLKVTANIRFLSEKEGGMDKDVYSGIMPSFRGNGELIMCRIIFKENTDKRFIRGEIYKVQIELPYGEYFKDYIYSGYEFDLCDGARVIGIGIVEVIE
jgi:hypothetical protein